MDMLKAWKNSSFCPWGWNEALPRVEKTQEDGIIHAWNPFDWAPHWQTEPWFIRITGNQPLQKHMPPMSLGWDAWEKHCSLSQCLLFTQKSWIHNGSFLNIRLWFDCFQTGFQPSLHTGGDAVESNNVDNLKHPLLCIFHHLIYLRLSDTSSSSKHQSASWSHHTNVWREEETLLDMHVHSAALISPCSYPVLPFHAPYVILLPAGLLPACHCHTVNRG